MYLTTTDLEMGIQEEILTVITRNREKAEQAIVDAIAEVRSYLCARYDMDPAQAVATRTSFFKNVCDNGQYFAGAHCYEHFINLRDRSEK